MNFNGNDSFITPRCSAKDAEDIALNFTGNHHQENLVKRLFQ